MDKAKGLTPAGRVLNIFVATLTAFVSFEGILCYVGLLCTAASRGVLRDHLFSLAYVVTLSLFMALICVWMWRYDMIFVSPTKAFRKRIDDGEPNEKRALYSSEKKKLAISIVSSLLILPILIALGMWISDSEWIIYQYTHEAEGYSLWAMSCNMLYVGALTILNLMLWFRDRILRVE